MSNIYNNQNSFNEVLTLIQQALSGNYKDCREFHVGKVIKCQTNQQQTIFLMT